MKKTIILAIALGILLISGVVGIQSVSAQDSNGCFPLVQKLAERFNLNADEVQEVFDEARQERDQEMEVRFEERLNQAVSDGKISEEQKGLILAKRVEIQARHEEMRDLSWEERREEMNQMKEEMKTWAEDNGVEMFGLGGFRGGRLGFGK